MNLGDILVSQLGKPHPSFGWGDLVVIAVILALIGGEVFLGHVVSKLLGRLWRHLTRPDGK